MVTIFNGLNFQGDLFLWVRVAHRNQLVLNENFYIYGTVHVLLELSLLGQNQIIRTKSNVYYIYIYTYVHASKYQT